MSRQHFLPQDGSDGYIPQASYTLTSVTTLGRCLRLHPTWISARLKLSPRARSLQSVALSGRLGHSLILCGGLGLGQWRLIGGGSWRYFPLLTFWWVCACEEKLVKSVQWVVIVPKGLFTFRCTYLESCLISLFYLWWELSLPFPLTRNFFFSLSLTSDVRRPQR